jgi:sterol desaturase/sphingolipid hydroxylase (fatty acid hydroxylase superfamily)
MILGVLWESARNLAWLAGITAIVYLAECRWPAGPQPRRAERLQNFLIFAAVLFFLAIFNTFSWRLPDFLSSNGLLGLDFIHWTPSSIVDFTLSAFLFAFVWDFFQYWQHRAMHFVPLLWTRAHVIHHESEHLSASCTLRTTISAEVLTFFISTIPALVICGTSFMTVYSSILLFGAWGLFNHANIRLDLGPLTKIVSGPRWHRIHHGKDLEYHDKNFAAFFPLWDVLFGTFRAPRPGEFPETGVADCKQGDPGLLQAVCDAFAIKRRKTPAQEENAEHAVLAIQA